MADGPAVSPEGSGAPVTLKSKEVFPKREGVATRLAESQRLLGEAQEAAKREFELQRSQFYDWAGKKSSEMPIVGETEGIFIREGVWNVEGEKAKRIVLEESKTSGHIQDFTITDVEEPAYELYVESMRIKLSGGGFEQSVAFNYPLNAMGYSYEKTTKEPVSVDQTPDVFGYSKGVLDFLGKATLQPAVPTQPASGQPTA